MFSIWDEQTKQYLHSGRNSDTKSEAIKDGIGYYLNGDIDEEITLEKVLEWSEKEQKELLAGADLIIEEHTELLDND